MSDLWKHFKDGGWGMYLILFWSIVTIGVIIERALYLYGSAINKDVFLATMQKCILAGDVAKAVKMCSGDRSFVETTGCCDDDFGRCSN